MNAFVSTLCRDLSCAAAALLISLVVSAGFVQSTGTVVAADAPAQMARSANA